MQSFIKITKFVTANEGLINHSKPNSKQNKTKQNKTKVRLRKVPRAEVKYCDLGDGG